MAIQRRAIIYGYPVAINAAALQAWHTTPIEAAPAPGPNRIIQPVSLLAQYKPGSYPFTGLGGGSLSFTLALDAAHPFASTYLTGGIASTAALLEQSANRVLSFNTFIPSSDLATAPFHTPQADSANKPLLLTGSADSPGGKIATSTINAAGLLYAANDTGTIDPNMNGSGTYRVLTVGGGGQVLTYSITNTGNGYAVANGLDTDTSGTGSGFKLNVTAINKGDGALYVTVLYGIAQLQ